MDDGSFDNLPLVGWRVLLAFVVSSILALFLVQAFPWFSGWQGAVLALLGVFVGVASEQAASTPKNAPPPQETSAGLASTAAGLAGALWGAASSVSGSSFVAGLIVGLLVIWVCWLVSGTDAPARTKDGIVQCSLFATLGFLLGAGITAVVV